MNNETLLFNPKQPSSDALKVVLAFPNKYSIGITSLGYQIIWATLAKRSDVDVKRLFTDQTEKIHRKFDLFGISMSWELDGPILLNLLEKQHIPIWSNERKNDDPIIFGGGPVLTANPEPFAPFLDVVLLGDGEDLVPSFIDAMKGSKSLQRIDILKKLAKIPGIYVPALFVPEYSNNGTLDAIKPIESDIPTSIQKQTWKGNILSHSTVITPDAAWPNIHMVETVRSCPELCRFCLASYLTLPFRSSSLEDGLIPAVEKGLAVTKRLGLLGASVTQHPEFPELLNWLNNDSFDDIHLSVSSVRAATVNAKMTKILGKRNCKSLTIAIESGSEKIRKLVNKKLSEEEILMAARYALDGGLKSLKLYGMVGLPLEEEEDIQATIDLLCRIKRKTHGLRLTLGVSTFVPKAHTPFQWYGIRPEAKKRLKILKKYLEPKGITLRAESYGWSVVQALISRADRRLAPVIALMKDKPSSTGEWKKAYKATREGSTSNLVYPFNSMPKLPRWENIIHEDWMFTKVLPWQHIEGPINPEILFKHQQKSFEEAFSMN